MKASAEKRCIVCQLIFCCGDCRWKHEQHSHGLLYDCPICRGLKFLCKTEDLNPHFIQHLVSEHFPLHCNKCKKLFETMEDLTDIDQCNSISELIKDNSTQPNVEEKFENILQSITYVEDTEDEMRDKNKNSKTAVITPIIRKKYLVAYESSDTDDDTMDVAHEGIKTPHPFVRKTPKFKQREATPHVKKLLKLMRQKVVEEYEEMVEEEQSLKTTPKNSISDPQKDDMTTPTSYQQHLLKITQAVTTSTPTHPLIGGWTMFPEQGADSPLSEIENGESSAQSINNEASKTSDTQPKLKGIILAGSRSRIGSQDSSEKHVTFQDSNADSSIKKKVKFADDTVFEQENKIKRVFRKPKRMLTPGPQKPRYCHNPRFQALINRFENQGLIMARTPKQRRELPQEDTPAIETAVPPRAIDFEDSSPVANNNTNSDDSYKTCIESPDVTNTITALTANIAGSLKNCLQSAFKTTEEDTEIQFKFVITKKKVVTKRITDEEIDRLKEERNFENKENLWSSVAKAVKNAFWGDHSGSSTTPHRSFDSTSSSASKRKSDELSDSDISPLNHKRHKFNGRITARPPLRRTRICGVSGLRPSRSAEQHSLMKELGDDGMNVSF